MPREERKGEEGRGGGSEEKQSVVRRTPVGDALSSSMTVAAILVALSVIGG